MKTHNKTIIFIDEYYMEGDYIIDTQSNMRFHKDWYNAVSPDMMPFYKNHAPIVIRTLYKGSPDIQGDMSPANTYQDYIAD